MELKFLFYKKYPIPDLKYPILELELIFDSQHYIWPALTHTSANKKIDMRLKELPCNWSVAFCVLHQVQTMQSIELERRNMLPVANGCLFWFVALVLVASGSTYPSDDIPPLDLYMIVFIYMA